MPLKQVELPPLIDSPSDWDELEEEIKRLFREEIYLPILRALGFGKKKLDNTKDDLSKAFKSGRLRYDKGTVRGRLNATLTKELRDAGARWDRKSQAYKIAFSLFPPRVQVALIVGERVFEKQLKQVDDNLARKQQEKIASKLSASHLLDDALWKTDRKFHKNVSKLLVAPRLTKTRAQAISEEWEWNLKLYIDDFTTEEIAKLRKQVRRSVFAGGRQEDLKDIIQRSYDVSAGKAKFLARQETKLLVTTFKESRYKDAGIDEYNWYHVTGSVNHPVRPRHKYLGDAKEKDGSKKVYRFSDPPNTAEKGQTPRYNNPGKDYNCRCYARAVVKFNS